jgi:uncharacterized protein (TIGR02145 family)
MSMKKKIRIRYIVLIILGFAIILSKGCKKEEEKPQIEYSTVSDIDGNTYKTVKIGSQWWMEENLKTTKNKDNSSIPLVTDAQTWSNLTTPGYCYYNYDSATYKDTYGALYNWYAATGKLCPTGWHVPSDAEWTILTYYLGGEIVAGGKLKETGTTHWTSPNAGATNETGFTALPGGMCEGVFWNIGNIGYWWSTTTGDVSEDAFFRDMFCDFSNVLKNQDWKWNGHSIRCVKD